MSDQQAQPEEVVSAPANQSEATQSVAPPAVEKSFQERVMERVEKADAVDKPKPEAVKPEVQVKPEAQSEAKAPEAAVIAERRKWQKRQDKVHAEMGELKSLVQSLAERLENKSPAQAGATKQDNLDEYIRANQDDPLVKRMLASESRMSELESRLTEHGSYIDKARTEDTTKWIEDAEKSLENNFKSVLPEVWKAKEEGEPTRFNEFEVWVSKPENEWAFRTPETLESAFKQFFYDDILNAKVTEARDEALKRRSDAEKAGITAPQQAAGTPSAFGKSKSFHERVMERVAASGGA